MTDMNLDLCTRSAAQIIGCSPEGVTVCASAARISTMQGTALELFERSREKTNNVALVQKVLASGHKSVMEHCYFNLAFNNVSIFAEQFIIEFRLASYTVKSRRYVDFGGMGYYVDEAAPDALQTLTRETAEALFARYSRRLELGIPKDMFEDYFADTRRMTIDSLVCVLESNADFSLPPDLPRSLPAAIMVGERERRIMRRSARRLHEAMPGSALYVLPGMKHGELSLAHPDAYARIVRETLRRA